MTKIRLCLTNNFVHLAHFRANLFSKAMHMHTNANHVVSYNWIAKGEMAELENCKTYHILTKKAPNPNLSQDPVKTLDME